MKTTSNTPTFWISNRDRKPQGVDPKRMREVNSQVVLRLLRAHSPCSRADLVRHSGLTAPTVSAAIALLQRRGLVKFLGEGVSQRGRPPSLLEFDARSGYVVGVDIGGSTVRMALADLSGAIVERWNRRLTRDKTPERITDVISEGVSEMRERHQLSAKKILAIAAGAPGITDAKSGHVLSAPNLTNWRDVPLRDLLRAKTRIPATVENDVNLAAIGESSCGAAKDVRNFVFLAIGTGVGAGIFLNGHLHHGDTWSAGEIGYMLLPDLPSDAVAVNRLGALESIIGGACVEREWGRKIGNINHGETCEDIFARATAGDPRARDLLARTARHLANAVTNLSLVLDTSLVVFGGGLGSNSALLEATSRLVSKNQFARPRLVISSLGVEAQLQGAVHLAVQMAEAHGFQRQVA